MSQLNSNNVPWRKDAAEPSPLDQAVTRVKEAASILDKGAPMQRWLATLLAAISHAQNNFNRLYVLDDVARICVEWATEVQPEVDALKRARDIAEGETRLGHRDETGYFRTLGIAAGQVAAATNPDATDTSLREALCTTAGIALAWAAELIKEEEK